VHPILATRLSVPQTPRDGIARSRLLDALDAAADKRLILVSAPAGFGKTTLLAQWLAARPRAACWVSLDAMHRDPVLLLAYVIEALHTVFPGLAPDIAAGLSAPFPLDLPSQRNLLINRLTDRGDEFWLVLDDFHLIDSPDSEEIVAFLLEHSPPGAHLVVASREDPPLPVARYRARGQLAELRMTDLAFTDDETRSFGGAAGSFSAAELEQLSRQVEGWPAGLRMALLASSGGGPLPRQFAADYLIEEVFSRQSAEVREFLTATSVLDRLSGPLCDFVLGRTDSQEMLASLVKANLFVSALDSGWYRYHHLFAEMLGHLLSAEKRTAVLLKASAWYENAGLAFEAFRIAAASGDIGRPADLIVSGTVQAHDRTAVGAVLAWLAALPLAEKKARPALLVRQAGFLLYAGQTAQVLDLLDAAEPGFGADDGDWLGLIAMGRATVAVTRYQGDEVAKQARRALGLLGPREGGTRFVAYSALGFAQFLGGDRLGAMVSLREAETLSRLSGDAFSAIMSGTNMGQLLEAELRLGEAEACFRLVLDRAGGVPIPYASEAMAGMARIRYQGNELAEARRWGLEASVLARRYDPQIDRFVLPELLLCQVAAAENRPAEALQRLDALEDEVLRRGMAHRLPDIAAVRASLKRAVGDVAAARSLADRYSLAAEGVRVLLAEGRVDEALEQASALRSRAESAGWADHLLTALVLESLALARRGADAAPTLERALELGRPGLLRVFADEGPALAPVLRLLENGYLAETVRRIQACLTPAAPTSEGPLSPRELEVLQLVAAGCTNDEIGTRLFIALDTVKGHNRKIFEKLDARTRTEAVATARSLKLL
jgi:LuxR family maltose regulon positive regulatory protein